MSLTTKPTWGPYKQHRYYGPGAREALRERLRVRRELRSGHQLGFMDWALLVPEPKAGRLDFVRWPFQIELYSEGVNDEEAVVKKSTQVGMSAWAVRWALYHADTKGLTGLYLFPTARDMWDFSNLRVGPVIRNSPHLARRQRPEDPNNKGMKGIGLGVVVFRGSEALSGLESIDADHMVFDEYDLLERDHIPVAERRTGASLYAYKRRLGWPSVPNYGIDRLYEESDHRQWMVKCECGEWQDLDFFRNVELTTGRRLCRIAECRKELDVADGEWVAKYLDGDRPRGYHVTQLLVPGKSMRDLIKASKKRSPHERQSFMNRDLGVAWAPEEGRLSDAAYEAAVSAGGDYGCAVRPSDVYSSVPTSLRTMGVDVASTRNLNVRVSEHLEGEKKKALFVGEVESFEMLDRLWDAFGVNMGAIDHLPEGRLARAWAERHQGQIYLVALIDSARPKQAWDVDDDLMFASVNRTIAIDAALEAIRGQRNLLPVNAPEEHREHLQALNRIVVADDQGGIGSRKAQQTPKGLRVFYRSSGPDDYAMAEVFDLAATELWWRRQLLDEAEREAFGTADDVLDFERSHLSDPGWETDYHPGGDDEYHPGGRE